MTKNNLFSTDGYTLIEVIVALQIFTIILTMAYTIYLYGIRYMNKWDENNQIQNGSFLIQKSFYRVFNNAVSIESITKKGIRLTDDSGKTKQFIWTGDTLFLNDKPIFTPVRLESFSLFNYQGKRVRKTEFTKIDRNLNGVIEQSESLTLQALEIDFVIKTKKYMKKIQVFLNLPKTKGRKLIFNL